jgi:hypothetical protein
MRKRKFEDNVYVLDEQNSCKLKLDIPLQLVNDINKELVKDHEISGIIYCNDKNEVIGINKTKGNSDSVYTPNDVINFHTHPISAYNNGNTVWGWPSGEDIRETIKFALSGNKAHLVFSVEGLFTIQVSPCKIKKLKQLTDEERGIIIFFIEEYFKSTHNFRGVNEVNKLSAKKIFINPYSYIDFVNTFDLVNLNPSIKSKKNVLSISEHTKNIGHTGIHGENNINIYSFGDSNFNRIPNMGFPDINGSTIETKSIREYITKEDLKELRKINKKGEEESFKIKDLGTLISRFNEILAKFDSSECNITWNNKKNSWFFINFFPSNNFRKKNHSQDFKFITPNIKIPVTTDVKPFIRIFSNKKEGCTVKQIGQNNKFKIGKITKIGDCKNCGFGKNNFKKKRISLKTLLTDLHKVVGKIKRSRI